MSYGIKIVNAGYITINHLDISGPGITLSGTYPAETASTTSADSGISCTTTTTGTYYAGIIIDDVTVEGMEYAMSFIPNTGSTLFLDGLRISNCVINNCGYSGIRIWSDAVTTRINRNIVVRDCTIYGIHGITGMSGGSGFPLFIFQCTNPIIERVVVHDYGDGQNLSAGNGVAGIMYAYCTGGVIRNCESYNAYQPNYVDGNAFDFDVNCTNCLIEYCYGHDTTGSVMYLWNGTTPGSTGTVVRYNVFVNGGKGTNTSYGVAFNWSGDVGSPIVYNNVFYSTKNNAATGLLGHVSSTSNIQFYNNIFSVAGGLNFGNANNATFYGNVYNVRAGSSFSLTTTSGTYTSLSALQGQDMRLT